MRLHLFVFSLSLLTGPCQFKFRVFVHGSAVCLNARTEVTAFLLPSFLLSFLSHPFRLEADAVLRVMQFSMSVDYAQQ